MKIILSPAKKMHVDTDNLAPVGLPGYLGLTEEILAWLRGKSKEELKKLWKMGRDLKQPWQMIRLLHLGHQPNPMTTQVLISTYPKAILTVI